MTETTKAITGERADLLASLAKQRYFLRYTVRELTDEQAAQRTTASELCLGGLIKHVAATEQQWIRFIQDGPKAMSWEGGGMADWMAGFRMLDGETLAGLLDAYDQVARRPTNWWPAGPTWTRPIRCPTPLVRARRVLVSPPGAAARDRGDRAACRARRHHPGVPGRRQIHGLT